MLFTHNNVYYVLKNFIDYFFVQDFFGLFLFSFLKIPNKIWFQKIVEYEDYLVGRLVIVGRFA